MGGSTAAAAATAAPTGTAEPQKMRALKIAVERSKAKRALDSVRKKKKAKKDTDEQLLDESD